MAVTGETGGRSEPAVSKSLRRRLEARVSAEQAECRLPSLVVGLARRGQVAWWSSRGTGGTPEGRPATDDTQYRVGSITKTFTAVAVMRLRDQGAVDLDDPVGRHLPELAGLPVSLAQLLSHTSGLRAETPLPWWERVTGTDFAGIAAFVSAQGLLWRPGRRFHYSNVGYALLGEVVARARGASWAGVLADELCAPAGLTRTSLLAEAPSAQGLAVHPHADLVMAEPEPDYRAMAPAGQLWSTVADLAQWSVVISGGVPDVLDPATAAEMAEPLGLMEAPGQAWSAAYGLGLALYNLGGRRRLGHAGGVPGHWAMLLVDQDGGDAVVALANSTYSGQRFAFFEDLLAMFTAEAGPHPAPGRAYDAAAGAGEAAQADLAGTWYWGPVEYRLNLLAGGDLELVRATLGATTRFRARDDGTWEGQSGYFLGEALTVERDGEGRARHFDVASFLFTRRPYDPAEPVPGGVDPPGWHARP
jgi:CubicO group peptidase (beta-lactamase class C family)